MSLRTQTHLHVSQRNYLPQTMRASPKLTSAHVVSNVAGLAWLTPQRYHLGWLLQVAPFRSHPGWLLGVAPRTVNSILKF